MTTPNPLLTAFQANLSGGGAGAAGSTTNRPAGRYYGVPDDYVSPNAPTPYARQAPLYETALDQDRRILLGLPPEQLALLQAALRQVGLISAAGYRKGVVDEATRKGFAELLGFANQQGTNWEAALTTYMQGDVAGGEGPGGRQMAQYNTRLDVYQRTDPARIRQTAEAAFAEAIGRKPKPEELARFVKRFQDTEFNTQRQAAAAQDANALTNLNADQARLDEAFQAQGGVLPSPGDADVDTFMRALSGQESGGKADARNGRTGAYGLFQIMPENWASWAKEAGLPANAPRTAENQTLVARAKLSQYKAQFGSWDAVAVAWYAGPGAVKGFLESPGASRYTRKQGKGNEPSIREYVEQVQARLGRETGAVPQDFQRAAAASPQMTGEQELNARVAAMLAEAPGKVSIGSSRRTREQQQVLYDRYRAGKGPLAARPGTSKHESGEANDLSYQDERTRQWVLANAHRYGLVFPVKGENWHVEVARGQTARFGPMAGKKVAGAALPANALDPTAAQPGYGLMSGQPLSTSVSITQPDLGAQAAEYARNVNPTETAAFDIGTQFDNFVGLLQKGVV